MHYNEILKSTFQKAGFDVIYQPGCLEIPYDQKCWPIKFPEVNWTDNTVVIMHCQDFITARDKNFPELKAIENHFGDRANQVVVVHWEYNLRRHYKGPLNLLYFPTHSYELLLNLRNTFDEWGPKLLKPRTKNWQCLNGTERYHRELVAFYMRDNFDNGVLSYGIRIPLEEWNFDTYKGCKNELNWQRLLPVYSNCKVNVVTETVYYDNPGIITEKTLMALLGLQIPIVIGYEGIVGHCERLGFDMFKDIIDISYDCMHNDYRWKNAIKRNVDIINGNFDYNSLKERLLKNQDYVLNHWPNLLIEQFNNNARGIVEYLRR